MQTKELNKAISFHFEAVGHTVETRTFDPADHQPSGLDQIDNFRFTIAWLAGTGEFASARRQMAQIPAWIWSDPEGWCK